MAAREAEEARKKAIAEKAEKRQALEKEMEEMLAGFRKRMKALEESTEPAPGAAPPAPAPAAAPSNPPATPAPAPAPASTNGKKKTASMEAAPASAVDVTPVPPASATPAAAQAPASVATATPTPKATPAPPIAIIAPPAPPAPKPEPPKITPAEDLALPTGKEPAPSPSGLQLAYANPQPGPKLTPSGPDAGGKATSEAGLEGLKFAPVGDVQFSTYLVRVKDFAVFAKETGFKPTNWRNPGFEQKPDHPVVNVSWNDAMAFCKWLTDRDRKSGILKENEIYRLPTDLEWSKAVGLPEENGKTPELRDIGVPDVYPWGTDWPPPPGAGNYTGEETLSEVAIKGFEDGFVWTSPVGSFPPNKYGLFDMGGNVCQWVLDDWNADGKAKVLRGGSWYNGAVRLSLLSSCRTPAKPDTSTDNYGFRIVKATEATAEKKKKR
jgi:formylglycine-generating enzyme required for sulfatase activity